MKAFSLRLDDRLARQFDRYCRETGRKKTAVVTRLIELVIREAKPGVSRGKIAEDPLAKVIGLIDMGKPLFDSPDEIDKVVYNL